MSIRKLEGTHRFLHMLVCDRCGYRVDFDEAGRSVMKDHLVAVHQLDRWPEASRP